MNPDYVHRERAFAQWGVDSSETVAIRNGEVIFYSYLHPRQPWKMGEVEGQFLGKTLVEIRQIERSLNERLQVFDGPLRGYLGWLLTNQTFLDEHDQLLLKHRDHLKTHRMPVPILSRPHPEVVTHANEWPGGGDWQAFYSRWRLQSLAAPYLPVPLAPQVPDCWTLRRADAPEGMITVTIPDISPTLGRGAMDDSMEDALRGGATPAHLTEWMNIVSKRNSAKNVIPAYERRFRLQHYWRVLHRSDPQSLRRTKRACTAAFASFLKVNEDTVKNDLDRIARNLGSQWAQRWVLLD